MNMDAYIEKRLDNQIEWYDENASKNQKRYKICQVIEIILASSIPLMAGYSSHLPIAIMIGAFGSIIAIIESIVKLYKFHENWIEYRSTCEMLRYHKYLYITKTGPYTDTEETIDNLFIRTIETIISSENNQWKVIQQDDKKKDKKS